MGLGLLGRGVGDTKFLAEQGADLIVTDLKTANELQPSLDELRGFRNIAYALGEHRLADFRARDFILKGADVPIDSPYLEEARKRGIPIEMSASLFAKLTSATIIGITGTRGKSTTTHLICEILRRAYQESDTRVFLGGNVRGVATLPLLQEAGSGDVAVLELDSWQLWGFGEARVSPHIAVFTTFFPDHMNYYKNDMERYLEDKANIFRYQNSSDILILGRQAAPLIRKRYPAIASRIITPPRLPLSWEIALPGEHNLENASLAAEAARQQGAKEDIIKSVIVAFPGLPGRLERVAKVGGVAFYDDTTATTPEASIAGLKALGGDKKVVLIMGGADKGLDMSRLLLELARFSKAVIALPGTGTKRIESDLRRAVGDTIPLVFAASMEEAVRDAYRHAIPDSIVLLSPGFASFGLFRNEFHRGEEFVKSINVLT